MFVISFLAPFVCRSYATGPTACSGMASLRACSRSRSRRICRGHEFHRHHAADSAPSPSSVRPLHGHPDTSTWTDTPCRVNTLCFYSLLDVHCQSVRPPPVDAPSPTALISSSHKFSIAQLPLSLLQDVNHIVVGLLRSAALLRIRACVICGRRRAYGLLSTGL